MLTSHVSGSNSHNITKIENQIFVTFLNLYLIAKQIYKLEILKKHKIYNVFYIFAKKNTIKKE